MRKSVERFANLMNSRLDDKVDDNGGDTWREPSCNIDRLRNALQKKVNSFHNNCFDLRADDVQKDCIDIANYSMMIVDRITKERSRSSKLSDDP